MNQAKQAIQDFLVSQGFQQERFERSMYWVRSTDELTRQAVGMAEGYVRGEILFSLWTEKAELFLKYLPHGELGRVDMARAELAKSGLCRVGTSGQRGWTSSEVEPAIEALRKIGMPWLDRHVSALSLIEVVEAGEREGPPEIPKRRLFGLLGSSEKRLPSAYQLTAGDKQRLGALYLELGQLKEAHRCYSDYLAMMKYTADSNPHRAVWLDALAKLSRDAGM